MKIQNDSPDLFIVTPDRNTFLSKVVNPYELTMDFNFNSASQMNFKVHKKIYDIESEKWIYNPCYDYLQEHMLIYSLDRVDGLKFRGSKDLTYNFDNQSSSARNISKSPSSFTPLITNAVLQNETELIDIGTGSGYNFQQGCSIENGAFVNNSIKLADESYVPYAIQDFIPVHSGDILFLGSKIDSDGYFNNNGDTAFVYRVHFYDDKTPESYVKTNPTGNKGYIGYSPTGRISLTGFSSGTGYIRIDLQSVNGVIPVNGWIKLYSREKRCKSLTASAKEIQTTQIKWWVIDSIEENNDFYNSYKNVIAYSYEYVLSYKAFSISELTLPLYIPIELHQKINGTCIIDAINNNGSISVYKSNYQTMEKGLINQILDCVPDWSLGYYSDDVVTRYRTVPSVDNENIYSFLINTVQSLYGCYILFDCENKTINLLSQDDVILLSDTILSWSNALKSLNIKTIDNDYITAMRVHTKDDQYSLGLINPTGNNIIYNFNNVKKYFNFVADPKHLKDDGSPYTLAEVIAKWETELNKIKSEYQGYGAKLVKNTMLKTQTESKVAECRTEYLSVVDTINLWLQDDNNYSTKKYPMIPEVPLSPSEMTISDNDYSAYHSKELFYKLKSAATLLENCKKQLQKYVTNVTQAQSSMKQIASQLSFNYIQLKKYYDSCKETDEPYKCVLTPLEALALQPYIYESNWTNENLGFSEKYSADDIIDTLKDVYQLAQNDLDKIYSKPNYEFSAEVTNIFANKDMSLMLDSLYLGNSLTIATEDDWIYPVLLSVHMDYDNLNNCTLSFSTDYTLKPMAIRFSQLFGTINQTSVETPTFTFDT